jgi:hypothetical protein
VRSHRRLRRFSNGNKIICQQSQLGIPQICLNRCGPFGNFCLLSQRAKLAAQLDREILYPRQIALHRIEFAQRLLFTFSMFKYARGFLDQTTALLRIGHQNGVELSLADDDMHLSPDPAIAEQLLDIKQTRGVTIYLVLTRAIAEKDPGNRDFGIFNGQCAIGVIDGD